MREVATNLRGAALSAAANGRTHGWPGSQIVVLCLGGCNSVYIDAARKADAMCVHNAGVRLLEQQKADLMYLSQSDYPQYKHAPGTTVANEFVSAVDGRLAPRDDLGAVVGLFVLSGLE